MSGPAGQDSAATARYAFGLPTLCLLSCVGVGVAASEAGSTPIVQALGIGLALGGGAGVGASLVRRHRPPIVLALLASLGLGIWRADAWQGTTQPWVDVPRGPVTMAVVVDAATETRGATEVSFARIEGVTSPDGMATPPGRVRITVGALTGLEPGERLELTGRFDPVDSQSPTGSRLLAQGIVATTAFPIMLDAGEPDAASFPRMLHSVRAGLKSTIDRMLPEPHSTLLGGLLVGVTGAASDDFRAALVASGTTHMVVVSGFNVMLVAGALQALSRGQRVAQSIVPLVGVWGFALLAGANPPAIRAAIMATVLLIATRTGRGADALNGLAIASAVMLAIDPALATDLSFQLSVLATLGLVALSPRVGSRLGWLHPVVREPVASTLAASLATAPLLAATFHQASVVAPVANVLAGPLVPVATILGAAGVVIAGLLPPLAASLGMVLAIPLSLLVVVIEATAAFPSALVPVGEIPGAIIAAYALSLLVWAVSGTPEGNEVLRSLGTRSVLRPAAASVVGASAVAVISWSGVGAAPSPLLVTVLDVGHGEAIFVRTPSQRTMLIDGGPNPAALLGQLGRRLGIGERELNVVILTRADADRLPGAVAAIERYATGLAIAPPEGSPGGLYERWRGGASPGRSMVVDQPAIVQLDADVTAEIYPTGVEPGVTGTNTPPQQTLAVRIVDRDVSMLFAPTITAAANGGRAAWLERSDVLLVPRHGEAIGISQSLLDRMRPSAAVISVGDRNRRALPASATLDLLSGIPLFRTDLNGSIELRTDGSRLWINADRA